MNKILCLAGWLALVTSTAWADVPPQRLHSLSRGINLDNAIYEQPDSLAEWAQHLASIRHAGLYHIRIFVHLDDWANGDSVVNPEVIKLDAIVRLAQQTHLAVILCPYSKRYPLTDAATADTVTYWLAAWRRLARHYHAISPDDMFFEIANEPGMDGTRWSAIQEQLRAAIRVIAPDATLLLTPSPLAMVWSLPTLRLSPDTNVAYVFHLYQPMVFTHQGAGWAKPDYQEIKGLKYPPDPVNIHAILSRPLVAANPAAVADLTQYEHLGGMMQSKEITAAMQWARQHEVHMVVTEFGADETASPTSRAAWLGAARRQFDTAGFGWTVFHYIGSFGIKSDIQHGCDVITQALGLCG